MIEIFGQYPGIDCVIHFAALKAVGESFQVFIYVIYVFIEIVSGGGDKAFAPPPKDLIQTP